MNFARSTLIIFRRQLRMNLRNPAWVIIGLMQPILYLVLFGPLLKPLASSFGASNAYTFFVPGLLVQLGIFGAMFAGFGLIAEWKEGVVEAERVTPAPRGALLAGRMMRDMLQLLVQAIVLVGLGFAFGMRGSPGGIVLGIVLTLLIGGACAAASNAVALTTKSEDVLAPLLNSVLLPILLLSGILLPMTLGPKWLQMISDIIPVKHIVNAVRDTFAGEVFVSTVMWGTLWALLLCALAVFWGTRVFRKENA